MRREGLIGLFMEKRKKVVKRRRGTHGKYVREEIHVIIAFKMIE